ncbi:Glycosyl transferase [Frankia canadensis]|uniref:Glycosyl transferase n=1 Tax=Frankia canadensis TaxID=1836972 RepID=A0A2I2KRE1_9ACTN|nr:cellulose synthase catalytic subunit [Frankia canadensis]SNQ48220.1 Glycosyl transferase [Frankia canadensis]SOU55510.1 Glycosyl transferase [Frankia canadensis]
MAYDYASFSTLAGPLREPPTSGEYHVAYRKIMVGRHLYQVLPQLVATVGLSSLFFVWLIQPQHYPHAKYLPTAVSVGNAVMFWLIVITEGIRLLNSITLCWSAFIMRNPIPVRPPRGLRVAFTTTIVPAKEPLDVVRDTLIAARNIRHDSTIDVWLLDEGNDPAVRAMCAEIGVNHFSRKGVERWNTARGSFRAKTKHGNHNSWLDAHGDAYDVVLSVDPDHIPLPNFAQRMLGYFRDPNVAFVVGPQVYGNFRHYLTRGAEAQNYMFHSVVQRAANRFACGMFVGTNHAYRVETWRQIGGFQDSITEDLATSFAVHGARNPVTRHRWTSVYTPDVVAVGEGPATWTDFFSQQLRWARGANEVLVTEAAGRMRRLSWGPRLHYATLMLHYPTVALTWILGMILTTTYMALGSTGVVVHVSAWLALYIDVFAARLLLYFWLRRFNTSPHEEPGSAGMSGIFVSVLCTPFYSTALVGAVFRRKLGFVVTPKGDQASPDRLLTFRKHLFWAAWSAGSIAAAAALGHLYPANMVWVSLSLLTCLLPIGLWRLEPFLAPRRAAAPNPLPAAHVPAPRRSPEPARAYPADPVTEEVAAVVAAAFADPVTEDVRIPEEIAGLATGVTADTITISPSQIPRRDPAHKPPGRRARPAAGRPQEPAAAATPAASAAGRAGPGDRDGGLALDQDTVVTRSLPAPVPAGVDQDTVLTSRREALAGVAAAAGDQPAYVEDVTMRLTPRRRRVSPDGMLEELA